MSVNHHFTSLLYYRDPDGNEVEITCDSGVRSRWRSELKRLRKVV